jgi:hypothetical protein
MEAVLGDVTKRREARPGVFLSVAVAVAGAFFAIGGMHLLGSPPRPAPPPSPCLVQEAQGLVLLDRVDNLESCGARLEAVYLESDEPVLGAYGGLRVFADANGIDAASAHGPRATLITPQMRAYVDQTLRELMARRDQRPAMQVSVVRLPNG